MNDSGSGPSQTPTPRRAPVLFVAEGPGSTNSAGERPERNFLPWVVAVVAVVGLLGVVLWMGRTPSATPGSGVDPYAKYLVFGNVQVSQGSNFAGDQLTYVDGTLENRGDRTVTSLTLRVLFANDSGDAPQIEQIPVSLVRSREPYVDIEPITAAPLAPGKSQDFRLIFDNVSPMWNQQAPQIQVLHAGTRP